MSTLPALHTIESALTVIFWPAGKLTLVSPRKSRRSTRSSRRCRVDACSPTSAASASPAAPPAVAADAGGATTSSGKRIAAAPRQYDERGCDDDMKPSSYESPRAKRRHEQGCSEAGCGVGRASIRLRPGIDDRLGVALAAEHHHQVGDERGATLDVELDQPLGR